MRTIDEFPNVYINEHPLVIHKLNQMRKKDTPIHIFRENLKDIAYLIGYEAMRDLPTHTAHIDTPLAQMEAVLIHEWDTAIVSILRAGLGMAEGLHSLLSSAREGHIGVYRNPETKQPVEYYWKLPAPDTNIFLLTDPMIATGNSAIHAIDLLKKHGVEEARIRFIALVAAPEGIEAFHKAYPTIPIYLAALDDHLNDHAYIVPGLGDAGDRLFGTG